MRIEGVVVLKARISLHKEGERIRVRVREREREREVSGVPKDLSVSYLPASKVNLVGSDPYLRRAVNGQAHNFNLELVTSQR